jgi:hypothetical protein
LDKSFSKNLPSLFITFQYKPIQQIKKLALTKVYSIKIGSKTFHYCKEQIAFLSINALDHFETNSSPFEILIDQNPNHISIDDLVSAFISIDSLFHSQTQMEINQTDVSSFSFLVKF